MWKQMGETQQPALASVLGLRHQNGGRNGRGINVAEGSAMTDPAADQ
jgi:hypothetical protein